MAGRPNVYGSVFRFEGQASVFATPGGPCYRCLHPEPPPHGPHPQLRGRRACSACFPASSARFRRPKPSSCSPASASRSSASCCCSTRCGCGSGRSHCRATRRARCAATNRRFESCRLRPARVRAAGRGLEDRARSRFGSQPPRATSSRPRDDRGRTAPVANGGAAASAC